MGPPFNSRLGWLLGSGLRLIARGAVSRLRTLPYAARDPRQRQPRTDPHQDTGGTRGDAAAEHQTDTCGNGPHELPDALIEARHGLRGAVESPAGTSDPIASIVFPSRFRADLSHGSTFVLKGQSSTAKHSACHCGLM